jgi:hypothetical protein
VFTRLKVIASLPIVGVVLFATRHVPLLAAPL